MSTTVAPLGDGVEALSPAPIVRSALSVDSDSHQESRSSLVQTAQRAFRRSLVGVGSRIVQLVALPRTFKASSVFSSAGAVIVVIILCALVVVVLYLYMAQTGLAQQVPIAQERYSVTIAEGHREKPRSIIHTRQLLQQAGVDTSTWGTNGSKSASDLFKELLSGQCELEWVRDNHGNLILQRSVRVLKVAMSASTPSGPKHLKQKSVTCLDNNGEVMASTKSNNGQRAFGQLKDPVRKICADDMAEEEVGHMLRIELCLDSSWQKRHLDILEISTFELGDVGNNFPGLHSHFRGEQAKVRIKDVSAKEVTGILGLPNGEDFQTEEDSFLVAKSRIWTWVADTASETANETRPEEELRAIETLDVL